MNDMDDIERIIARINDLGLRMGLVGDRLRLEGDVRKLSVDDREAIARHKDALAVHLSTHREHVGILCRQRRPDGCACGEIVTVQRPTGKLAWCQTCFPGYPKPDDDIVPNVDHVVLPMQAPAHERPNTGPAMYVAADLEFWITDMHHMWADKVIVNGKAFARLTPGVIAWFKERIAKAEVACTNKKISLDQFARIVEAFCPVYEFAVRANMISDPVAKARTQDNNGGTSRSVEAA